MGCTTFLLSIKDKIYFIPHTNLRLIFRTLLHNQSWIPLPLYCPYMRAFATEPPKLRPGSRDGWKVKYIQYKPNASQ